MKKILTTMLVILLLITNFQVLVCADNNIEKYHINLKIDNTEKAKEIYSNPNFKKGNKFFLDYYIDKSKNVFLNINVFFNKSTLKSNGEGVLKVEGRTFPLKFEGKLYKYKLKNGKEIYYGPQNVDIKIRVKKEKSAIALFINPQDNDYLASISIGEIYGKNGTGFLFFGKPTEEYIELINMFKNEVEKIEDKNLNNSSDTNRVTIQAETNYKYVGESYSTQLYHDIYGQEQREYTENWVGYIHVHDRGPELNGNGSGTTQVRVFSNTNEVEYFASSKSGNPATSIVESITVRFGFNDSQPTGAINITNNSPKDDGKIESWGYLSYIPKIGYLIQLWANMSADLKNANPDISSTNLRTELGRVVEIEKVVDHIWNTSTDYDSSRYTIPQAEDDSGKGLTFQFDWSEYADGYGYMYAETEILYYVSAGDSIYTGYFWTHPIVVIWQENFL